MLIVKVLNDYYLSMTEKSVRYNSNIDPLIHHDPVSKKITQIFLEYTPRNRFTTNI